MGSPSHLMWGIMAVLDGMYSRRAKSLILSGTHKHNTALWYIKQISTREKQRQVIAEGMSEFAYQEVFSTYGFHYDLDDSGEQVVVDKNNRVIAGDELSDLLEKAAEEDNPLLKYFREIQNGV